MWKVYKKGYLGEMSFKAIFFKVLQILQDPCYCAVTLELTFI